MKILYMPQRSDNQVKYEFFDDKIIAHYDGKQEVFDFSHLGDGKMDSIEVETLPIHPIIEAKRENGELKVKLVYHYGIGATEAELFPDWKNADELEVGLYGEN